MKSRVICIIMGGGRGTRLWPLTQLRCKPAVPLAGKYRLVDIPISNCITSGFNRIFVLTQFNTASLHRHIQESYKFDPFGGGCVDILSAEQTEQGSNWYQGTADAVRQNLHHFSARPNDLYLILSGDQLYRMDFREIIEQHRRTGAAVTIAAKPMPASEVHSLGVMRVHDDLSIAEFAEKPKDPEVVNRLLMREAVLGKLDRPLSGPHCLASMGIYVFNYRALHEILDVQTSTDFGREVIPSLLGKVPLFSFIFNGYWEDIGTVRSFFEANLSLADPNPPFDFFEVSRPIFTRARYLPPSRVDGSKIEHAMMSDGCLLHGAQINRAVLGVRSVVENGSALSNVVMMGADFYETPEQKQQNQESGIPNVGIGPGCDIRNAIIDKNARIGHHVRLSPEGKPEGFKMGDVVLRDGILIVIKGGVVPNGTVI